MRPAPLLLWLLLGWTALGFAASAGVAPLAGWWAAAAALAAVAGVDAWRLRRTASPEMRRELAPVLPLGPAATVALDVRNVAARRLRLRLHDGHPGDWSVQGMPRRVVLPAGGAARIDYRLVPAARGRFEFAGGDAQLLAPWALWTQRRTLGVPAVTRVYPNFAVLAELAGLRLEQASRSLGARLQRRRGEGTEFHELRDYRDGDSLRRIDWKASARSRRLISRDYREERSQQVVLMLDCGRRLLARDGALAHFDQALDAALALAGMALREGDAVGLLACTGGEQRWLPPQRGAGSMDRLLAAGYDLQARPVATDYPAAASALLAHQHRRALVMFITDVRDEDSRELRAAIDLLSRRHLVVLASLRDTALDAAAASAAGLDDAIRAASAIHYLGERARVHDALRSGGVNVLDVRCAELPAALIGKYLALKRGNRL